MTMAVSVVMPTYNRWDTLREVLPTIARQTMPSDSYEILVCDSGSTDGTEEGVASMGIPNLRFLKGENRGRSGARNLGIRHAAGEIVLFTDADILADERLVEEHALSHEREPGIAVVGCEVQVDSLDEYRLAVSDRAARRHMHSGGPKHLKWLFFLTGNASAPRKALLDAGLFDESFTGYGHEDLELGYRLQRRLGMKIRYNPSAVNYHWHPTPFEERCEKMRLAGISTVRFYVKHGDPMINLLMGVNPLSMVMHSLVPPDGRLMRRLVRSAVRPGFSREIVLQHHYLTGVKTALAADDLP